MMINNVDTDHDENDDYDKVNNHYLIITSITPVITTILIMISVTN